MPDFSKRVTRVTTKETDTTYIVSTIEVYGNVKTVRVNCQDKVSWLHTELKDHDAR